MSAFAGRPLARALSFPLVLTAVAAVLAACSSGDGSTEASTSSTTTTTTETPTTAASALPPGAAAVAIDDLAVGQCFVLPSEDPTAEDRAVWAVGCDSPHTHEVLDIFDYAGDTDDGAYPGTETVQFWSEDECFARFEPFVGVPWTRSELDIELWWPSEDSWSDGDRTVVCAVFPSDGGRVTGTSRNSRR